MNNKFTARMKAWLTSFALMCLFALPFEQARAQVFTTDTSWRVTSTVFGGWQTTPFVMNASWVVPGGGNVNCGIAQPGVVGAPKIWFPASNAFRTCYFRKKFFINQLCEVKTATVEIAAADNYLVYVNGVALASGNATAKTFNIPVQLLQCENVIAVQARDIDAKCWWMSAKVTINSSPITFTASSNSSSSNPLCAGQTLNLTSAGLAGATYYWTGPNGFTSNLQNPTIPSVTSGASGIYTVVVMVGKCCKYVAKVEVFIKDCTDCLDFISKGVICKNGQYYINFCIKNNSSHTVNAINLISTTPGVSYTPNIITILGGLAPGATYCTPIGSPILVSGTGATAGALVCLKAMLLEIKQCQPAWFCTSKEDLCFKLPDCPQIPPPCDWTAMVKDSVLTICKGASVTLSAYTVPAVGATYNWTSSPASVIVGGATATPTVTPSANPTVYTVYYTTVNSDGTLCKKTRTVTVYLKDCPNPCDSVSVNFNPSTVTICLGDSVQLNPIVTPAVGLIYLWTPSTGLSSAFIKNPWAKPLVTTTYNLIVSYTSQGVTCTKDRSMTVVVKQCPPQPCQWQAMVKDTAITICKGASTVLGAYTVPAVGGVTYNWTSSPASLIVGGNTATPTVTPSSNPTTYTVTITQASTTGVLCTRTATVKVYLKDCPAVIPCDSVKLGFAPNTVTICLGDSVMLNPITNPVTGLTYLWIPATGLSSATIKNPWAKPLVTTTYNLIISVPNSNCKKDGSMTVIVKPCNTPVPCQWKAMVKDSAIYVCRGASAILGAYTTPAVAGAMYSWTSMPASTIVNGATASPTVTPLVSPTVYTVTISVPNTDGTVCTQTAKVTVYWKDCQTPVGTRVAADENTEEITVAPNPTQSVISVQIPDSFNWKSATLINQQGVILNEQDRTDDAKSVKFDVQKQPSGIYIIRVKTDKGFVNKKVIKE
jgi:Secretion system C-terminal sorting domain